MVIRQNSSQFLCEATQVHDNCKMTGLSGHSQNILNPGSIRTHNSKSQALLAIHTQNNACALHHTTSQEFKTYSECNVHPVRLQQRESSKVTTAVLLLLPPPLHLMHTPPVKMLPGVRVLQHKNRPSGHIKSSKQDKPSQRSTLLPCSLTAT